MDNNYTKFFSALAERMGNENDLSDMTYALLRYSDEFKAFFIHEFFPKLNVKDITGITREKSVAGDRPDFWIQTDEAPYLIEVKINDRGHHFAQYCARIADEIGTPELSIKEAAAHLGYITNYTVLPEDLTDADRDAFAECESSCREWKDVLTALSIQPWAKEDALITGYIKYAEKLCDPIACDPGWRFATTQFDAILDFQHLMLEAVNGLKSQGIDRYPCTFEHCPNGKKGIYMKLDMEDAAGKVLSQYPFVGVYFGSDDAQFDPMGSATCQLCVGFESTPHWGDIACAKKLQKYIPGICDETDGRYFYPRRVPQTVDEMKTFICTVLDAARQDRDQIVTTGTLRNTIGGSGKFPELSCFRSIRNLTITLNKAFTELGLNLYSYAKTIKDDPCRIGEWCWWDNGENSLLYMWIGVIRSECGKAEFVCEIDTAWNHCASPSEPKWHAVNNNVYRLPLHTGDGTAFAIKEEIQWAKDAITQLAET